MNNDALIALVVCIYFTVFICLWAGITDGMGNKTMVRLWKIQSASAKFAVITMTFFWPLLLLVYILKGVPNYIRSLNKVITETTLDQKNSDK